METLKINIKQPYLISGSSYRIGLYSLPAAGSSVLVKSLVRPLISMRSAQQHKNNIRYYSTSVNIEEKLNPWFVTGFACCAQKVALEYI